jgi:glycerol-3-phosphate dehydrogenase
LPTTTTIASTSRESALEIANLLKNNNFLPVISNDIGISAAEGTVYSVAGGSSFAGYGGGGNVQIVKKLN